eukprot:298065_1
MTNIIETQTKCNAAFSECPHAMNIKLILERYNKITHDKTYKSGNQLEEKSNDLVNNLLSHAQYSNVKLLNDFYHVKYDHNTNDDAQQFNLFYQYLCDYDDV